MTRLTKLFTGAIIVCLCTAGYAWADTYVSGQATAVPAVSAYGYSADEVAVNQGAVVYWYAHGFANAYGHYPMNWAELQSVGLPLRKFVSPHTGQEINFDDGMLDFDGDMVYMYGVGDVQVHIQTTGGVVVLPGILEGQAKCSANACQPVTCNYTCCDITICGFDCWDCCGDQCICEIIQWMLWRSFETYECRYGTRPCDDVVWIASGMAPIDADWRLYFSGMDIEYVWGNCVLKKAYVHCCEPCTPCRDNPCTQCAPQRCNECVTTVPTGGCTTGKCGR